MTKLYPKSDPVKTDFLLDRFPLERRSLIASQYFTAVREGATTVDDVIRTVKADTISRMLFADRERWNVLRQLLSLLETEEARRYAREVLAREALPPEEKQKHKAARSEQYRRDYLRAQTPTEKQLSYLKSLGCKTVPANRFEASELIEAHKG